MTADIGLIGLAVMGQNLVLNIQEKGFQAAVFNRTASKVDEFLKGPARGSGVIGATTLKDFFQLLKRPRRVIFMVKAGVAVDELIQQSLPYLEPGDILIDGGNSFYEDTNRRCKELEAKGIHFLGVGISGGEEGARHGPSIMPGGHKAAWPHVESIFKSIAAKTEQNEPCCEWVGEGGAGHFVKMVHNGIEYGDMQLISESYDIMRRLLQLSSQELHDVFHQWNRGVLNSYLIEITSKIFLKKEADGTALVEKILDVAGQKGTGKWTSVCALDMGVPLTLISEAVFARYLSADIDERRVVAAQFPSIVKKSHYEPKVLIQHLEQALYAAKIMSYSQGFTLLRQAAKEFKWQLDFGSIALLWRQGCIIRSGFLLKIKEAFQKNPELSSLFLDSFFADELQRVHSSWRIIVAEAAQQGVPIPCMSSALSYFDGMRSQRLPTNLLQAQRDFFGAHTFERIDTPRGAFFHADWE